MITKFKKKKKINSIKSVIFSVFFVLLTLLIIGFFVFTNWKINRRRAELSNKISVLKLEVEILEQRNQELKEKKSEIESEDYVEKVAREQLDLKKPGEEVVVVQKEEEEEKETEEKKSWWDKFKSIFQK